MLTTVVGIVLGCGEEPAPPPAPAQPVKIFTVPVTADRSTLEYAGEIAATQHEEAAFEVAGKIVEFPVVEGQAVTEGQMIARLDQRDFEADLDRALANLEKAETDVERYRTLFEKGVGPKTDVEAAERMYANSEASYRTAQKAFEDSTLRATFDGVIAKKLVADFQNVTAKQPIVILQDDSTLEISVAIPEQDYVGSNPDLTAEERTARIQPEVIVSSLPDRSFPARLKEVTTTADPVTRTFRATAQFDPPDDVLIRPGMTARVRINTSGRRGADDSITIPAQAMFTDPEGKAFVWKIDPTTFVATRAPIVPGPLSGSRLSVREGVAPGDQIAVSGVHKLADGMKVRPFGKAAAPGE
jgi:RND family efflux transporter MFP subunit